MSFYTSGDRCEEYPEFYFRQIIESELKAPAQDVQQNLNLYEELSEDIFQSYRKAEKEKLEGRMNNVFIKNPTNASITKISAMFEEVV